MAASNTLQASIFLAKHRIMITLIASLLATVSDSDGACLPRCDWGSVCCMEEVCVPTSCQGRYCGTSSDCSIGETCCNSQCVQGSGCAGQSCTKDYQCDYGEKCCDDVCTDADTCHCDHDPECPIGEICCHGSCSEKSDCPSSYKNPTLPIVGAVIGSLLLISLISIFIYLIYRRRWKIPPDGSAQTVTASVATPNHTAQSVPATSTAEEQSSSATLYAPQNFYGTIPSSPASHTF